MSSPSKCTKLYIITNSVTDDLYVGSTTQALYKRLYKHKYDVDKGVQSKLCNLMRKVGKDKFTIEMLEEGVFSDADAVNARETFYIRERRCSLNEGYALARTEAPTDENPPKQELCSYIVELQRKKDSEAKMARYKQLGVV